MVELAAIRTGIAKNGGAEIDNPVLVHYLRVANVQDGYLDLSEMSQLRIRAEDVKRFAVLPGDMLMNEGGDLDKLGRGALWKGEFDPCVHQNHVFVVRCGPRLLPGFLSAWTGSANARKFFMIAGRQTTNLASINKTSLGQFPIPLPPTKAEQQAIAEALSDADALIESLSLLLAKKRQIKQGAMQELLTGKRRLPGFSGQWTRYEIGNIAFPSTEVNTNGEALPVLACSKHFGFVDSLGFFKNQVFSRDTANYKVVRRGQIGYPANHIEEGSIGLQDLYEVALVSPIYVVFSTAPDIDSYFLHRLLKLDQYRQTFSSATSASVDRRGSLRWPELSKINVVLPLYKEQCAVRDVLRELEAEIAVLEAKLDKARLVRQGMMQELLTGRIRLVRSASKVMRLPTKPSPIKPPSTQPTHNWQINEAVVIGVLAQRFGSERFPLPRKRRVKLTYLLHRHAEGRAEGYLKKAAGPYDPNTKYKGPEQIALKNGFVRALRNDKYEGFVAGDKVGQAQCYFEQWYGVAALDWLERFHYRKTDDLELLATVDMAMVDLAANGEPADETSVKRVIAAHPEWLPKLSRELFSDERIAAAIAECQTLFRS